MKKHSFCILFGGVSPEHEVSLRSAESVLNNLSSEKYHIFPVGITKQGEWVLYGGTDYSKLPDGSWLENEANLPAMISPHSRSYLQMIQPVPDSGCCSLQILFL